MREFHRAIAAPDLGPGHSFRRTSGALGGRLAPPLHTRLLNSGLERVRARRVGELVSVHVIPRPHDQLVKVLPPMKAVTSAKAKKA